MQAVDQDLNYSDPATVSLTVHLPYERAGLYAGLGLALLLLGWQGRRLVRRGRQLQTSNQTLAQQNEDLARARDAAEAANRAKSRFLANMSHEIRTPMNAILGYTQLLQRRPDLVPDQRAALDTIRHSGDHLLQLINDVLDLARIEADRLGLQQTDFDLHHLLRTLAAMFELRCRQKHLAWQLEGVGSQPLWVHGDEGKLRQILVNLLGNAVKFTREGTVGLRVRTQDGACTFAVHDTGPGIVPEELHSLFEEFRQGAAGETEGGTGLGLTLAQRFTALMGGQLSVDSAVGEGACFAFEIPLPPAQQQAPAITASDRVRHLAPGTTLTALIADDVAANRAVLKGLLEDIGVVVRQAVDGQQALDQLARDLPDIAFLDIRMPVLDGVEAVRQIRARAPWADLKVVAISASTLEHQRQQVLTAGFDGFIGKPFRFEDVCRCLAELLQAEFIYDQEDGASPLAEDWSGLALPADLTVRLQEAAEFRQVTQLEACFRELEQLDPRAARLAAHLRGLRQRHDMDAILTLLEGIAPHGRDP